MDNHAHVERRVPQHHRELRVPRPLPIAMLFGLLAGLAALLLLADVPTRTGLVLPISLAIFGAIKTGRASIELGRIRAKADRELMQLPSTAPLSPLLSWRAAELTGPRSRRQLARVLKGISEELDGTSMPGALPINRRAARPYLRQVRALAGRIGDLGQPVTPRGIVLVERLLSNGLTGSFYGDQDAKQLGAEIQHALRALDTQ
jgi:hypothetical protein